MCPISNISERVIFLWNIMLCHWVFGSWLFDEVTWCPHLQGLKCNEDNDDDDDDDGDEEEEEEEDVVLVVVVVVVDYPLIHCHIPEQWVPQWHCFESLKTCNNAVISIIKSR